jgi:hypothetical protein
MHVVEVCKLKTFLTKDVVNPYVHCASFAGRRLQKMHAPSAFKMEEYSRKVGKVVKF